jgi:anti-sigma B factor antagonist
MSAFRYRSVIAFARKGAAMADSDVLVTHLGGDQWVIAVEGEHDLSNISHLQAALNGVFATGTSIVLDLSDATFIDSSVIRTLLAAHQRAQATTGEQLAIVAPEHSFTGRVIDLTGLQPLLPIYATKPAALRAIGVTD